MCVIKGQYIFEGGGCVCLNVHMHMEPRGQPQVVSFQYRTPRFLVGLLWGEDAWRDPLPVVTYSSEV